MFVPSARAKGRAKQAAGAVTGDKKLERQGKVDEAKGHVKGAVEEVKHAVKQAVKKLRPHAMR
jgi:uncharacterized protein YjbJ (UPF0337 family)